MLKNLVKDLKPSSTLAINETSKQLEQQGKKIFKFGFGQSPFKVPEDITLMVVDPNTGNKAKFSSKNTIIESYKSKNISNGKILYSNNNRLDDNNILRFY